MKSEFQWLDLCERSPGSSNKMKSFQQLYFYFWIHFAPGILSEKVARTAVAKVSKNELMDKLCSQGIFA